MVASSPNFQAFSFSRNCNDFRLKHIKQYIDTPGHNSLALPRRWQVRLSAVKESSGFMKTTSGDSLTPGNRSLQWENRINGPFDGISLSLVLFRLDIARFISLNGMKASMDMSTWMKRMNMNIENIEHKINKYREVTKYISNFSVECRCTEGKTIHKFSFFFLSSDWVEMEGNSQYCVIHLQTCQRSRNCLRSEDGERVFTGERGPPTPLCRSQTSPQPEDVNAAENLERTKPWQ